MRLVSWTMMIFLLVMVMYFLILIYPIHSIVLSSITLQIVVLNLLPMLHHILHLVDLVGFHQPFCGCCCPCFPLEYVVCVCCMCVSYACVVCVCRMLYGCMCVVCVCSMCILYAVCSHSTFSLPLVFCINCDLSYDGREGSHDIIQRLYVKGL